MSMNLNIRAEIVATLPNGKQKRLYESFDLIQTPTVVTEAILATGDPFNAYCEWIREHNKFECGEDHIRDLTYFINTYKGEGYEIYWYSM